MPRKERYQEAGHYHIINRGVERRSIYLEPEDYAEKGVRHSFETFLNNTLILYTLQF